MVNGIRTIDHNELKGSVWDSQLDPEFNMKHLQKAKGHIILID